MRAQTQCGPAERGKCRTAAICQSSGVNLLCSLRSGCTIASHDNGKPLSAQTAGLNLLWALLLAPLGAVHRFRLNLSTAATGSSLPGPGHLIRAQFLQSYLKALRQVRAILWFACSQLSPRQSIISLLVEQIQYSWQPGFVQAWP